MEDVNLFKFWFRQMETEAHEQGTDIVTPIKRWMYDNIERITQPEDGASSKKPEIFAPFQIYVNEPDDVIFLIESINEIMTDEMTTDPHLLGRALQAIIEDLAFVVPEKYAFYDLLLTICRKLKCYEVCAQLSEKVDGIL